MQLIAIKYIILYFIAHSPSLFFTQIAKNYKRHTLTLQSFPKDFFWASMVRVSQIQHKAVISEIWNNGSNSLLHISNCLHLFIIHRRLIWVVFVLLKSFERNLQINHISFKSHQGIKPYKSDTPLWQQIYNALKIWVDYCSDKTLNIWYAYW